MGNLYRKRDVVVEAIRFHPTGSNIIAVCEFAPYEHFKPDVRLHPNGQLLILTSHGRVWVNRGDWILRQKINGEWDCWPVTDDVFRETYMAVEERESVAS